MGRFGSFWIRLGALLYRVSTILDHFLDHFWIIFGSVRGDSLSCFDGFGCVLWSTKSEKHDNSGPVSGAFLGRFGSFLDPFRGDSLSCLDDFGSFFGSFLDHFWRLARSISIDLWIIFGGSPRRPPVYWVAGLPSLVNGPPSLVSGPPQLGSGPLRLGSGPPHSSAARLTQEWPSRTRPCGDPQPPPTYRTIPIS